MKTDINGCSTTAIGEEQFEWFTTAGGKEKVQYDYRHTNGKLFSCVAQTLEGARSRRDEWLTLQSR